MNQPQKRLADDRLAALLEHASLLTLHQAELTDLVLELLERRRTPHIHLTLPVGASLSIHGGQPQPGEDPEGEPIVISLPEGEEESVRLSSQTLYQYHRDRLQRAADRGALAAAWALVDRAYGQWRSDEFLALARVAETRKAELAREAQAQRAGEVGR